jgi:hypothetical protein
VPLTPRQSRRASGLNERAITFGQIGQGKGNAYFYEQKEAKNFIFSEPWALSATQNQTQHTKSFCTAFFKKRPLSLSRSRLGHE